MEAVLIYIYKMLKRYLFKFGWTLNKATNQVDLINLLQHFHPVHCNQNFIRLGGETDGGYFIPDDLEGLTCCFSIGVGHTSNFELELYELHGIPSYLADHSVDGPAVSCLGFHFTKNFIGSSDKPEYMTFTEWYDCVKPPIGDKILQMDIEGGEWDFFINNDLNNLNEFRILVVEFHEITQIIDRENNAKIISILRKIAENYLPVFVSANKETGATIIDGICIPRNIEVTYLRRDRLPSKLRFTSEREAKKISRYECARKSANFMLTSQWFGK